jgi:hypothetical protein
MFKIGQRSLAVIAPDVAFAYFTFEQPLPGGSQCGKIRAASVA